MGAYLGVSAFYHDSAAAIVRDGEILVAAQEERFTRIKHDRSFPLHASRHCLEFCELRVNELDGIVFYEKPLIKFERLLETFVSCAPGGVVQFIKAMPVWASEKLFQKKLISDEILKLSSKDKSCLPEIFFTSHHHSHAASAFFPSPFENAAILCVDGVGEWASTSAWIGKGLEIKPLWKIDFPHSVGLLYSAFTYYCGFKVNSGEYKLMGLAPFGVPRYAERIYSRLIDLKLDGSFRINTEYFTFLVGQRMVGKKFEDLFGACARRPGAPIEKFHADIAASIQLVVEDILLKMADNLLSETGMSNLVIAGGVGLNCVANSKIAKLDRCKKLWIQPASGDAGGAIGAAMALSIQKDRSPRLHLSRQLRDGMNNSQLGPEQSDDEIEYHLTLAGAVFQKLDQEDLLLETADALASQKIVGWVQGRMEFGPRALGNRSILADPRSKEMQSWINKKIKFREGFRPFAPVVSKSQVEDYFDLPCEESPYMLLTGEVREYASASWDRGRGQGAVNPPVVDSSLPAVTHVDGSARVQTVDAQTNPLLHRLLNIFEGRTGIPVLVNTSFNIRGEPVVFDAKDAFRCFMNTHMDILVVGSYFLKKEKQLVKSEIESWKNKFPLD